MKTSAMRVSVVAALAVSLVGGLAACASSSPAPEPVTASASSLQGETVKVPLGSELNIKTGSLSVTSYSGTVADPSIAKFIKGRKASGATFDPAVKPLKAGKTVVTLSNSDGGIQDVVFVIDVTSGS